MGLQHFQSHPCGSLLFFLPCSHPHLLLIYVDLIYWLPRLPIFHCRETVHLVSLHLQVDVATQSFSEQMLKTAENGAANKKQNCLVDSNSLWKWLVIWIHPKIVLNINTLKRFQYTSSSYHWGCYLPPIITIVGGNPELIGPLFRVKSLLGCTIHKAGKDQSPTGVSINKGTQ